MKLAELASAAGSRAPDAAAGTEVTGLAYDSRRAGEGALYFCVPGEHHDGHDFAGAAVRAGACALVTERELGLGVPELRVGDARAAMAPVAAAYYAHPSLELPTAAITGTNGKTTTAWLLREILLASRGACGLMGTVKRILGGVEEPVIHTTPEAVELQADLRRMADAGDRACVLEASSHALELHRCDSIAFQAAIFTNLTQDHLDFHGEMERYFQAKRRLFELAPQVGVVNIDDPYGERLAGEFGCLTFSAAGRPADFRALEVEFDAGGCRFELEFDPGPAEGAGAGPQPSPDAGRVPLATALPGHFNVANTLAAVAAAWRMGVPVGESAQALSGAERVPGRFEPVECGQGFAVLVDYAHTPDSLENVLIAARRITGGRLIAVFGAGGDRDRAKRPKMGRAGCELADLAVITSDNPRSEDPGAILAEVAGGCESPRGSVELEVDRRAAIARALSAAGPGDTVVIAGKGHEQGQELAGGRVIPFDDRVVTREILEGAVASEAGPGSGGPG